LTTGSFAPQLVQSWRTRSAKDISWLWIGTFMAGLALWTSYGAIRHDLPVIGSNGLTLILVVLLAVAKYTFESQKPSTPHNDSTADAG